MKCPTCSGSGKWPSFFAVCIVCKGNGMLPDSRINNPNCPVCGGKGKWPSIFQICKKCGGWGKLPKNITGTDSNGRRTDKATSSLDLIPILDLITQGECQTLEFKQTLQYNIHTSQADTNVFHSSLKTIAAFLNADGGTLLIGVSDSGEIMGIENEKKAMGKANNDRFELKIRDAISGQNSRFTPATTGNIQISFEELNEGMICRIDVQPLTHSEIQHFDKDVYLRDGNRTIRLTGPDLTKWIQRRIES